MNTPIMVGSSYTLEVHINDDIIHSYAAAIGDNNPVHLNDDYASRTPFGHRIAHGGIIFGVISRILGMHFPGPGTIFLEQNIKFLKPVFPGDAVTFITTAVELLPKNGCRLETKVYREETLISEGYSFVKLPISTL